MEARGQTQDGSCSDPQLQMPDLRQSCFTWIQDVDVKEPRDVWEKKGSRPRNSRNSDFSVEDVRALVTGSDGR